ncbi:MAG TPA: hypothetical protein PLH98_12205, partial [Ruminococcus flavefaciens]|nr:hypothetical protein [Ruminococcus flavefaciens]
PRPPEKIQITLKREPVGGLPYKNKTNNKQKQAGERPETHRFARSKRVYERFVIASGGVPAES